MSEKVFVPQEGPQTDFLTTDADIAFYGGAAGAGKSFALLLEATRNVHNPKFSAVIFRREGPEITNPGGLLDESRTIYPYLDGTLRQGKNEWRFPEGSKVKLSHMQYEHDVYTWKGSAITFIGFDEVTTFTELQFFYMMSRNRSMAGVPGYIRGTCNPDPDSWVARFISWWIDQDTGFAIPSRSGVIRWFIRQDNEIIWADTAEELKAKYGKEHIPTSFTFITASLYDNKILMEKDPTYLSKLLALPKVERERLLGGNWKIKPSAGLYFKKSYFKVIPESMLPARRTVVRYWDRAATEKTDDNNPDWSVGLKMSVDQQGRFYVEHVERFQESPAKVEERIKNMASVDGKDVTVWFEQDPGQAGKFEANYYVRVLAGYTVRLNPVSQSKVVRAGPVSSQAEAMNIFVVEGKWNETFFSELENFPSKDKMDQVDAFSGAFNMLTQNVSGEFTEDMTEGDVETNTQW